MPLNTLRRDTRQPLSEFDPLIVQRRVVERLARQFGISATLAQSVAGLAGLGPQEAR
jgi:hypothetical protein